MTKILLINPRFSEFTFGPKSKIDSFPLGLLYIGSFLTSKGYEVKLVNCLTKEDYISPIKSHLASSSFVGISSMTTQVPEALKISELIKDKDKDIPVVWGGVHPTLFPKETASEQVVDYVVKDEGELTMLRLSEVFQKGKEPKDVKGIVYYKSGHEIDNEQREYIEMDELPPIDWSLIEEDTFHRVILAPIHTSRGCPHKCTFCINSITKNRWRAKSADLVLDELELVVEKFKGIKIRMWDENFFVNKKRAIEIIDGIYEREIDVEWETTVRSDYFRPNFLNEEFLAKLKKSGCYKLCFGAESGSQRILEMLCKGVSREQIVESASQCKKFGIIPEYSFMIGLPEEGLDDMKKTIQLIDKLLKVNDDTEFIGPQPFRPYPGSPLYNKCVTDYGWKSPNTLREWSDLMEKEWGYLSSKNFPWIKNPDFVDALWPYLHYALTDFSTALSSGVDVNKMLKIMFILTAKIRFRFKYFNHPIEYKVAKRFI